MVPRRKEHPAGPAAHASLELRLELLRRPRLVQLGLLRLRLRLRARHRVRLKARARFRARARLRARLRARVGLGLGSGVGVASSVACAFSARRGVSAGNSSTLRYLRRRPWGGGGVEAG